jgi:hypothetical protein
MKAKKGDLKSTMYCIMNTESDVSDPADRQPLPTNAAMLPSSSPSNVVNEKCPWQC